MKTQKNMTNKNLIASIFIAVIILLSGCKKNTLLAPNIQENNNDESAFIKISKYYKVVDLMAGEHLYKVGRVEITDLNNGTLEVKYTVDAPYKIHSIKLFVGAMNNLPIDSKGECITDMFPYKKILTAGGSITSSSILLRKSNLPKSGIIVANAKIINQETLSVPEDVWANGTKVTKSSASMYFNYNLIYISPPVLVNEIKNL